MSSDCSGHGLGRHAASATDPITRSEAADDRALRRVGAIRSKLPVGRRYGHQDRAAAKKMAVRVIQPHYRPTRRSSETRDNQGQLKHHTRADHQICAISPSSPSALERHLRVRCLRASGVWICASAGGGVVWPRAGGLFLGGRRNHDNNRSQIRSGVDRTGL